jgi:ATP-binding cassette subfamily B protein
LRRLWIYLQGQRWGMVAVVLLAAITTVLSLLGPLLLGVSIDRILANDLPGLARAVALMALSFAALSLATWLQTILMIRVAQRTVRDLRHDLFARLQTLPLRFFDERTHGELMSRLTNDVEQINTVLTNSVTSFLAAVFTLIGVVVVMFAVNIPLAFVSLLIVPMMVYLTRYIARNSRQGFRDQQASLGILNGLIEESITGGKVVRAYGREAAVIDDFEQWNHKLRAASIRAQTYSGLLGPGGNLVNNIGFAIVATAGAWMAVEGLATVGTIAAFLGYAQQLRRPVNDVSNLFNTIQAALAGAERVFAVLDEVPEPGAPEAEVPEPEAPVPGATKPAAARSGAAGQGAGEAADIPLPAIAGRVVFQEVCFGYTPGIPVLKHVSLTAEPGQTIALVGPTGAGKTTIINLLSRFYDVDAGTIFVDDHDIRTVRKADLRRQLGIVLQDTYLFAETVMDNIRYGRLDATDDEVIAAARLANADHFIRRLPHGYATPLSERAGNLSQGQRQLLAIARAILADPRILVLDEATSSVDTRTEAQIQEALLRLMKGRTSFVIAHRLSTIREADEILVIRDGEIVERGTHDALLAQRAFYHELYLSQFRGAALPGVAPASVDGPVVSPSVNGRLTGGEAV